MKFKTIVITSGLLFISCWVQATPLKPQMQLAHEQHIIDGQWVAVGINRDYAIIKDATKPFNGKPSYKFTLKADDNTLSGYQKGSTKGRAELSFTYATKADIKDFNDKQLSQAIESKTLYHYGKGIVDQGQSARYQFSFYLPSDLKENVNTIFAQWHGMPDRRLVQFPNGEVKTLTADEFSQLLTHTGFKKNIGYHKLTETTKLGKQKVKLGKKNGYLVEQGGYPPLAMGLNNGWFYIKANSDSKWLSDKTDRTNVSIKKHRQGQVITSDYKQSTFLLKQPMASLPKDTWITFDLDITWSTYDKINQQIKTTGHINVDMTYLKNNKIINNNLVPAQPVNIGRNDNHGYYFKFGIYRVGSSNTEVSYNLAEYSQQIVKRDN